MSTELVDQDSSLRARRYAEKEQLQDLNSRLKFFIGHIEGKNLEIEKLNEQLRQQRKEAADKLASINKNIDDKMAKYKDDLSDARSSLAKEKREKDDLEAELKALQKQNQKLDEQYDDMQSQNLQKDKMLADLRKDAADLKNKLQNMGYDLDNLKDRNDQLKDENNNLTKKVNMLDSENRNLKDSYDTAMSMLRNENARNLQELEALKKAPFEKEDALRKKHQIELENALSEQDERHQNEMNDYKSALQDDFNRQWKDREQKLQDLNNENAKLKAENEQLYSGIQDAEERAHNAETERQEAEKRAHHAEKKRQDAEKRARRLGKEKDDLMNASKTALGEASDAYERKNLEFNELMGVKVELTKEIQHYRNLLAQAEKNEGYESPVESRHRKRRRIDKTPNDEMSPVPFPQEKIQQEKNVPMKSLKNQCPLDFASIDVEKGYFEIVNVCKKNIQLDGWQLWNRKGNKQVKFPKRILKPNGRVRIIVGKDTKASSENIVWRNAWDGNEENIFILIDKDMNERRKLYLDPDMIPTSAKGQCFVM